MAHASRNPSASAKRILTQSKYRRSSSACTNNTTSTPLTSKLSTQPLMLTSFKTAPRTTTPVMSAKRNLALLRSTSWKLALVRQTSSNRDPARFSPMKSGTRESSHTPCQTAITCRPANQAPVPTAHRRHRRPMCRPARPDTHSDQALNNRAALTAVLRHLGASPTLVHWPHRSGRSGVPQPTVNARSCMRTVSLAVSAYPDCHGLRTCLQGWHQGEVAAKQGRVAPHIKFASHRTTPKEKRQVRRGA